MKAMNLRDPRLSYIFMTVTVFLLAFEFIVAKTILSVVPTFTVIWMKYAIAFVALLCVKAARRERWPFTVRDIPYFILCALTGEIIYYYGSFSAMDYLPVALLTVVLALCPVLSIILERLIYKKRIMLPAVIGICVSLFGITLVAGVDIAMFSGGRLWGYLLAFIPVVSTNIYNFIVLKMVARYSIFDISIYVIATTAIITFPMAIGNLPEPQSINAYFIGAVMFLGLVVGALGFFIYVNSLSVLGPTTTLMFSNFVPVVAVVFGWMILNESILPLQLLGGAITLIGCGSAIWYNGKSLAGEKSSSLKK